MTVNGVFQMHAFAGLLAAVALNVGRLGPAHSATVLTLRDWSAFFVDVLQRSVCKELIGMSVKWKGAPSISGAFFKMTHVSRPMRADMFRRTETERRLPSCP